MTDPFTNARLIKQKYKRMMTKHHDRVIALWNMVSTYEREETNSDAKRAFGSIKSLMNMLGLMSDENYEDEE